MNIKIKLVLFAVLILPGVCFGSGEIRYDVLCNVNKSGQVYVFDKENALNHKMGETYYAKCFVPPFQETHFRCFNLPVEYISQSTELELIKLQIAFLKESQDYNTKTVALCEIDADTATIWSESIQYRYGLSSTIAKNDSYACGTTKKGNIYIYMVEEGLR